MSEIDPELSMREGDVELERCTLRFEITVNGVQTLEEATNIAAINIARYGLNSMFVQAIDLDTNRTFIMRYGEVTDIDSPVPGLKEAMAALDEEEGEGEDESDGDS